ncbi:MAG: LPS assembly protein LptD [Alphaproteobacteria bacterium]|nr:LPS assembly protein LptD [Alphaproteobacteria bacterium]
MASSVSGRWWELSVLRALAACTLVALICSMVPAEAQEVDLNTPIYLQADAVSYDDELGLVTASGAVEVAQGERLLLADSISYNQRTGTVTASGDVKLIEPSGEVFFADYVELSNELRDGVIEQIRVLLENNGRFAAAGGRRSDGRITELARGVYSACDVCREDPTRAPLWQLKANRIVHDQQERQIEYFDASLEFYGVPVAYTPYFTHADPSVERKTGFLTPTVGTNSDLGFFTRVPFFWAIADDKDATIEPIYTDDEGLIYSGEYRQRFNTGEINLSGSFTVADRRIGDTETERVEEDDLRGHLFADARFDIDDQWRAGLEINRSSDRDYLRRFDFFGDPGNANISNGYVEGFNNRNYIAANGYVFQDLRSGVRDDEPLVLPDIQYNGFGEMDQFGGRWSLDANLRTLQQDDRADSQRASADFGYELPYTTSFGLVATASLSLRTDLYYTDHNREFDDAGRRVDDGFDYRASPRARMDLRYPFIANDAGGDFVVEPVVGLIAAPNGGNSEDISNDDSTVVELDESNIFDFSSLPGLDRVEGGTRVLYGLRLTRHFNHGGMISAFAAQRHRLTDDADLEAETGLSSGRSDIVGRIDVRPTRFVNAFYRARFDEDDGQFNRSEFALTLGTDALGANADYVFLRDGASNDTPELDEVKLEVYGQWDDYWRAAVSTTQDLEEDESLAHAAALTYEDECFLFSARYSRTFTGTSDAEPSDSLIFRFTLKTLTTAETSSIDPSF